MTFARAKPSGWTDNVDVITATQMNTIDTNQSNALDGAAGGPYTPASEIEIDGAGIRTDTLNIDGVITVETGGSVVVDSGATFQTNNALVDLNSDLDVLGDIDCEGEIDVEDRINMNLANTTTDSTIAKQNHAGTGANDGFPLRMLGQAGQAQTGGAANNDGGMIERTPGAAGTGGGGTIGGVGYVHLQPNNAGSNGGGGLYKAYTDDDNTASGTTVTVFGAVMGVNRTAALTVELTATHGEASVDHYSVTRKWLVSSDGAGALTLTVNPGNPIDAHNIGFATPPSIFAVTTAVAGQIEIQVAENDGVIMRHSIYFKLQVGAPLA